MSEESQQEIINHLNQMRVIEIIQLVKKLENEWGVSAAAPAAVQMQPAPVEEEKKEEQVEFDVMLAGFDSGQKMSVVKELRKLTSLALREAKEKTEASETEPVVIGESLNKTAAETMKATLVAAGARVEIK